MTKPTKAALLSGLIFPGIGHLILKKYLRGSILMVIALVAMSALINVAFQQAQTIVDRIVSGEVALEAGAISDLVANAPPDSGSLISNVSAIIFLVCWLVGIIDSYRVGVAAE